MTYALYHLTVNGRTVELSHSADLPLCDLAYLDSWLSRERQRREYQRGRLAELKETHGCGYRPGLEAVR